VNGEQKEEAKVMRFSCSPLLPAKAGKKNDQIIAHCSQEDPQWIEKSTKYGLYAF
jgi:hypothetical protein